MALIVADGTTNMDTAESYDSIAEVTTYATEHGLTWTTTSTAACEAILRNMSRWLDARYRTRFTGYKVNRRPQLLEWPRHDAYDRNDDYISHQIIPREVKAALAEAAVFEQANPGVLYPEITQGEIAKRIKVDVIEIEYANVEGTVQEQRPILTVVEDIMSNLLSGEGLSRLSGKSGRC